MEPRKDLNIPEEFKPNLIDGPHRYFDRAFKFAQTFYKQELTQIGSVDFTKITPDDFFSEVIWVIHATGFNAKAVGKFINRLQLAYGSWESLGKEEFITSFIRIKLVCNNPQKSSAVHKIAGMLCTALIDDDIPWSEFRDNSFSNPEKLQMLPYIGPVTCYHLARNIGLLDYVKPDLHLVRMATYWGYKDCVEMCKSVQPDGMPLGVVDYVLWLAAATFGTIQIKNGNR